jgi:hypothetical protein
MTLSLLFTPNVGDVSTIMAVITVGTRSCSSDTLRVEDLLGDAGLAISWKNPMNITSHGPYLMYRTKRIISELQ